MTQDPTAGAVFAQSIKKACDTCDALVCYQSPVAAGDDAEGKVAAFFVESGMSVAGVILPPQGYLKDAYKSVRGAGGVCVADEVQV